MSEGSDEKILNYFYLLKKRGQITTSYLFIGDNFSLVKKILKLVACLNSPRLCNQCWDCQRIDDEMHPDLFVVEPQGAAVIKIESIKDAQRFLSLKSFRLRRKLLLIKEGEFSPEASSSLLKTLEEPPQHSFIGICAFKTEGILPTLISRCQKIFLPRPCAQGRGLPSPGAGGQSLSFGEISEKKTYRFDLVSQVVRGESIKFRDRQEFAAFLMALIGIWRDYLVSKVSREFSPLIKDDTIKEFRKSYSLNFTPCRGGVKEAIEVLRDLLKIYGEYHNINENLALNLIRTKVIQ